MLYQQGQAGEARAPLVKAQRLPDARDNASATAGVLADVALAELETGDLASATRHVTACRELLETHGLAESYVATNRHVALAGLHAPSADVNSEVSELELAGRLSAPARPSHWHAHALLRLASARHRLGNPDAAREALGSARADLEILPDPGMLSAVAAEL